MREIAATKPPSYRAPLYGATDVRDPKGEDRSGDVSCPARPSAQELRELASRELASRRAYTPTRLALPLVLGAGGYSSGDKQIPSNQATTAHLSFCFSPTRLPPHQDTKPSSYIRAIVRVNSGLAWTAAA